MRGYKQLAPLVADDDAIDIDQLVRDAASGVQADARARRTDTPNLTGGGDDDLPYIPLDLDESEYTFQAPRIEPRRPMIPSGPMSSAFANAARGAFDSARSTLAPLFTPRAQTPASPSAPLASPPPAAQTAPGTTPQPPETQAAPQAQQAPAVAPPGQGGQPPAQDAAEEAPLSSVPTEGGNMRPEAAPMLTPMADRARKFAEAPGAFKPTGDEETRLADAQRLDDQGARRQRIARGILSGLGLLGAATGLNGLAGIGAAGLGATNAASRAPNERTNRVREEIARRMQGMQAEREAANQAATREAQGIESQRQAARQSRLDDANIALTEARTSGEIGEADRARVQAELDEAARTGNLAAARAGLEARVNAVQHPATRAAWLAALPGMLQAADPELLMNQQDDVGRTDIRRGGQGAGGSGGNGSRVETTVDANGNVVAVRRRTGPRAPGVASPTTGASAAPTSEDGAVLDVNDPAAIPGWIQRTLNRAGLAEQDTIAGYLLRWEQAPSDSARAAVLTEVSNLATQAERDNAGGNPAGANPQEWHRMRGVMAPFLSQHRAASRLESQVRTWIGSRPVALRAAMALSGSGDTSEFDAVTMAQAHDILGAIAGFANPLLAQRSGAAVTDQELARFLREFAVGRWLAPPQAFLSRLSAYTDQLEGTMEDNLRDFDPRQADAWLNQHFPGGQ